MLRSPSIPNSRGGRGPRRLAGIQGSLFWLPAALVAGPCSKHYSRGHGVEQLTCLIDVTLRLLHLTSPARVVRPANRREPGAGAWCG